MNLEKINPRADYRRRKSTGNSTIQANTQRRSSTGNPSIKTYKPNSNPPTYLEALTGSCHDFCKYGIKRALPVKPWRPVGRKLDKNRNVLLPLKISDEDQRGKRISASPRKLQPSVLVKPESRKTDAFGKQLKKPLLKSASDTRKDKKSSFPPVSGSVLPTNIITNKSFPKKTYKSEAKSGAGKPEREKTRVEDVPEKIIHVIEPEDKEHYKEKTGKWPLIEENRKMATRGSKVIIPEAEKKDMAFKRMKFRKGKVVEIENGKGGSTDRSLRKLVSEDKFVRENNDKKIVLRHRSMEPKDVNSVLTNIVIEETASKLVKRRMSSVWAKNAMNIMLTNVVDVVVGNLSYFLFGFAFAFGEGPTKHPVIGTTHCALKDIPTRSYDINFFLYQ
ncbi:Ammonium transporter 1 member 3 [Striga hermonthica]|uniref:Ammonium transporter 1 member 3 n=1 Tax=Striga hermonthica TaxID=68872 RepID=A0A9N7MQT1_STRHE|nr:Ammonium transporter 1 member 3 [Striga hermonthica]